MPKSTVENVRLTAAELAGVAVESIADTFDLELLEKWLEEEQANKNRTTVVKAIENQIDDIKTLMKTA